MADRSVSFPFDANIGKFVLPTPTEADPHHLILATMDTLRARYGLIPVQGRPDELVSPSTTGPTGLARSVSVSYASRSMRVRLHAGRQVVRYLDFPLVYSQEQVQRLRRMCDGYFNYQGDDSKNARLHFDRHSPDQSGDFRADTLEPIISVAVERPRRTPAPVNDVTDSPHQR